MSSQQTGFQEVCGDNSKDLQMREIKLPTGRGTGRLTHQGCREGQSHLESWGAPRASKTGWFLN